MAWTPLSRDELQNTIERELVDCSDEQRAYFKTVAFEPTKWTQSPYGARAEDSGRLLRTAIACFGTTISRTDSTSPPLPSGALSRLTNTGAIRTS